MSVFRLVAFGALGNQAHAAVLIAHAAFGFIGFGQLVVVEFIGGQYLIAAAQKNVAVQADLFALHAVQIVAGHVRG